MDENQTTNQEHKKHFLTLHISHKGQQKTMHFRMRHAAAICAAAAIVVGGAAYSVGSYQKTKADLQASEELLLETERENRKLEQRAEALESENNDYNENIDAIQNKTTELEQKMNELENVKENLYDQIDNINAADSSSMAHTAMAVSLEVPVEVSPTFTSIVATSYNRASSLSTQLDKMNQMMDEAGLSFTAVAEDVTYTLASQNNIPSGWPVESRIVSTEFNPTGDPSISDGRKHEGMDISTRSQYLPIYATAAGTVVTANYHRQYGYQVIIDHYNGFTTLYAHCDELLVQEGDMVKKGDVIGITGNTGMSTGIHCHYEIQLNGVYQNPRDYL